MTRKLRLSISVLLARSPAFLVSLIYAIIFTTNSSAAEGSAQLTETFKEKAPPAWAEYLSWAGRLQGRVSWKGYDRTNGNKLLRDSRYDCKRSGASALIVVRDAASADAEERAEVANSQYAFHLKRENAARAWVVAELDVDLRDGASVGRGGPPERTVQRWICRHFLILDRWLPEWVKEPEFSTKQVTSVQRGSKQLVRVEVDYNPREAGRTIVRGGWLLLDPEKHWVIREYEVKTEWDQGGGILSGRYEYNEANAGFPILKRYVMRHRSASRDQGSADVEHVYEFDLREQTDVPEKDFTLTAFGLPEIPLTMTQPKPGYVWQWLIGSSVVVGILAIALGWYAKKRFFAAA